MLTFYVYFTLREMIPAGMKNSLKSNCNSPTNSPTWKLTATRSPRNFFPTNNVTMWNWGHSLRCVGITTNKISEVNQIGKKTIRSPIPTLTRDIHKRTTRLQLIPELSYIHMGIVFSIWKIINRMRRVKMSPRITLSSMATNSLRN